MDILHSLTFSRELSFSDLNRNKLPNDHFSYHLKKLREQKYIEKSESGYKLTNKGKSYISHMDTSTKRLEKLPKVSVFIIVERTNSGATEYLTHTRKKEPYYNYSGFLTGKLRFGEKVSQAANRELQEEAGLQAKFAHRFVLHEQVYTKTGDQLEDKLFHIMKGFESTGRLISKTSEGINRWLTENEFRNLDNLFHNELDIFDWFKAGFSGFKEEQYVIGSF